VYTDNVAQVCFEFSLLGCYIFILLAVDRGPLAWDANDKVPCIVAVAGLQFLYLAAFTFLLLESTVILHKLVDCVVISILEHITFIVAVGFGVPAVYTAVTLPFIFSSCWLNLSSAASNVVVIPLGLLFLSSATILIVAILASAESGLRPISASLFEFSPQNTSAHSLHPCSGSAPYGVVLVDRGCVSSSGQGGHSHRFYRHQSPTGSCHTGAQGSLLNMINHAVCGLHFFNDASSNPRSKYKHEIARCNF